MSNKSQHAKLLSSIKEAVQSSTDEDNGSFIVGSILLFEQYYAASNKENFRKILSEALAVYGPGTKFDGDDRVIPLYILLGKYSRSSTPAEIYDRMNETGTYRKSAKFYIEWSKVFHQAGHTSRAKEIVCDGLKRNARPEHVLDAFIKEYGMENAVAAKTPGRSLPTSASRTTKKQLFPKSSPTLPPKSIQEEMILPTSFAIPEEDPSRAEPATNESLPLVPLPIDLDDTSDDISEDTENVKPEGSDEDSYLKRKTLGVLVPATGFQLEDYDLAKVYEEEERKIEKIEANKGNIENGSVQVPRRGSCSPTSSAGQHGAVRALFQKVQPSAQPTLPVSRTLLQYSHASNLVLSESIFPPSAPESRTSVEEEIFVSATDAFKNLRPEPEEDPDDRRLTGFDKMLLKRKKSLASRQSLANPKPQPDTLDVIFSKMKMSSPSTSQQ